MSTSKRASSENYSAIVESEGSHAPAVAVKQRSPSYQNDNSTTNNKYIDENSSPQITKNNSFNFNNEFVDSSDGLLDELSVSDEVTTIENVPVNNSCEQQEEICKTPESKRGSHLSLPQSSAINIASVGNSSPGPRDDGSEKLNDNHCTVDSVNNPSPGAVSQDSSLFPDNLSRSSESGKSVDCISQKSPEVVLRQEINKAEKIVKAVEKKEKKKSPWYNVLNPTYKSRSEDFKRLFKDLPDSERLIVDYSCALQKDILVHGRLYVSQNYICFYANIFRWETFVLIRCRDVTSMTKEKTARVIPNAIQITTESEKHFFTSFGARDKTFLMLFRIWQNALLEQPMSSQELWQWVHYSYGEELGLTSDDDDYVAPPTLDEEKNMKMLDQSSLKDGEKDFEKTDPLLLQENQIDITEDNLLTEAQDGLLDVSESYEDLIPNHEENSADHIEEEVEFVVNQKSSEYPTDMSDTNESVENEEEDSEIKCPCSGHDGKEVLNTVFPLSVDQVFSLVFSGSKFYYDLLASRKTYDIMESPWQFCPDVDLKMRQVTYTLTLNHSMAKSAQTTETQRLLKHSKPGQVYTVDCDVVNTGIPYSDTFSVKSVYCLTKVSKRECRLRVFGCVRYKKSVWGLVKSLIEKSAMQGLADFATDLETALNKEAECSSQPSIKKPRRRKRLKIGECGKSENLKDVPRTLQKHNTIHKIGQTISSLDLGMLGSTPDLVVRVILVTLVVLLFLNMLLFYKLWSLEDQSMKQMPVPLWDPPIESHSALTKEDILQLLQKQDALHRAETERWRDALSEVIKLIHLVENSLSELKSSIDTYSAASVLKSINLHNPMPSENPPPSGTSDEKTKAPTSSDS